ncbi:hypothetical protein U9M48_014949 [Paspalum notatum var. saurae]|uniref:RRM domain-containing protein n=1 Tax=Paspalum notatum var. saurae TaxID=547442 RepID=A0AAQ3T3W0_PASNO
MAAPNSQSVSAAPTADSEQDAVTAPLSPRGAPGVAVAAPKQGATMAAPPSPQGSPGFAAPPSPQGAPGFAVVPEGAAHVEEAPASPQGPPGFWVAPQEVAPTPPQGAPAMAPPQAATMMAPQQQHFAHELVPGTQQGMQMPVQQASMGMIMASLSMSLQAQAAQAQAMAVHQPAQGMAPSQPLSMYTQPMMEMQQAQAGHLMAQPPLRRQQQQPSQADTVIMSQPPLPFGPPPATLQQQMMLQAPMSFSPSPVMLQHNHQGNQMTVAQPQLSAPPCKRQRDDQYDNFYGQHMTGHQQETSILNAAMGQSYGLSLQNGFPSFGAPGTYLPPDATSTLYVDGLPINCTRREVAHIFRQYMGFRELRLVNKGLNKHAICFVDFATPEQAFFTMKTLQGYKFDEQDHNSRVLNLQFSHSPRMGSHGGC